MLDEYVCQRRLIEALGLPDEAEVSQQCDPARRLRQLEKLNEAKACLRRQLANAGTTGRAVELAVAELGAEYKAA